MASKPKLRKSGRRASPPPRAISGRQRQRLIEACISALHVYGPSQTTVEKVVAIAKLSPGIVRFYFDSKAAMLVASLQFLADEFEQQVLVPVSRLKHDPVRALQLLVDLYLDAQIASPRKVSVWYSFWGEASSRKEYYDLCGKKDENFAALVREIVGSLIKKTGKSTLDTDGVSLGLIGVLEVLWQDLAFQEESVIDRSAVHARAMSYLASVFPAEFGGAAGDGCQHAHSRPTGNFGTSPAQLFDASIQLLGHRRLLPEAGSYIALEIFKERALVARDRHGIIRAFRNCCPRGTHALAGSGSGTFDGRIRCELHSLQFDLDGSPAGEGAGLHELELVESGGFLCTSGSQSHVADDWMRLLSSLAHLDPLPSMETVLEADWSIVVKQWLERPASDDGRRAYVCPNQLLELRDDGATVSQVVPLAAGRCIVREFAFAQPEETRRLRVMRHLADRRRRVRRRRDRLLAESAQAGIDRFGYGYGGGGGDGEPAIRFDDLLDASRSQLSVLMSGLIHSR